MEDSKIIEIPVSAFPSQSKLVFNNMLNFGLA